MKKLLTFMGISFVLQTIYYFIFLHSNFMQGNYDFNIISFVSVFLLLGWFIIRTSHTLRYGFGYFYQQLVIALGLMIMFFSFIFLLGMFGSWGIQTLYFYFYDRIMFIPINPIFLQVWENHLITYQIILLVLNIYVLATETKDEALVRKLKKFYILFSIIILLTLALCMLINLNAVFFYDFFIITMLIYWFFAPILFLLYDPFKHYYGVLTAWLLTTLLMWDFIDTIFSMFWKVTGGYIWS